MTIFVVIDLEDHPEGPCYAAKQHHERPRDPHALGDMFGSLPVAVAGKHAVPA